MEDIVKMHILYVEDDAPSGRLLQSIAQAAGYNVRSSVAVESFWSRWQASNLTS
jgi:DNA-binding response OmpR family regulator